MVRASARLRVCARGLRARAPATPAAAAHASPHPCRRPHAVGLQHPEGVHAAPRPAPARRRDRALACVAAPRARARLALRRPLWKPCCCHFSPPRLPLRSFAALFHCSRRAGAQVQVREDGLPRVSAMPPGARARAREEKLPPTGGRPSAPLRPYRRAGAYAAARVNGYFAVVWGSLPKCSMAAFVSRAPAHFSRATPPSHPGPSRRAPAPQLLRAPAAPSDELPEAQVRPLERAAHQEEGALL